MHDVSQGVLGRVEYVRWGVRTPLEYRALIGQAAYVHSVIRFSRALIGQAEECLRFMSYAY